MRVSQSCPQRFPREFNGDGVPISYLVEDCSDNLPANNVKENYDDTGEGRSLGRKYSKSTDNLQHQPGRFESTMDLPKTALNATTPITKSLASPSIDRDARALRGFLCLDYRWFSCQGGDWRQCLL